MVSSLHIVHRNNILPTVGTFPISVDPLLNAVNMERVSACESNIALIFETNTTGGLNIGTDIQHLGRLQEIKIIWGCRLPIIVFLWTPTSSPITNEYEYEQKEHNWEHDWKDPKGSAMKKEIIIIILILSQRNSCLTCPFICRIAILCFICWVLAHIRGVGQRSFSWGNQLVLWLGREWFVWQR